MADVAYPGATGMVGVTEAATFIPELWSDEIRAAYKNNLVLAPLVKKLNMKGKKGDTMHVPAPTRGSAAAKAENTAVTIQANVESEVQIVVDKHFEYSRLVEDIVSTQALSSLRRFYTEDAGYALAKQVDTDLHALAKSFGDGDGSDYTHSASFEPTGSGGVAAYAATGVGAFDDGALRAMIQKLYDADIPMDNRFWVIPPGLANTIRGIDRYVSSDFVNNGKVPGESIGNLYGIPIYVSTNCATIESGVRASILGHRDTMILAEQLGVRTQTQYKQEYLADLMTADTLYGVKAFRPDSGFVLAVNG
jgi:hypothetical protein